MKKVDELKDLGCYVRGRFYVSWSTPVLRAPAVHGVSSLGSSNADSIRASSVFESILRVPESKNQRGYPSDFADFGCFFL